MDPGHTVTAKRIVMIQGARTTQSFTALDWIGASVAGFPALGLLLFPLAGRAFASMFRDMGSPDRLPTLTRLAVSGWFPPLLGLLVVTAGANCLRDALPLPTRRAFIIGAFLLGAVGLGLCLLGAYLPIFSIANAVKAG